MRPEETAVPMAAPLLVEHAAESLVGQSIGHYQVISLLGKGGRTAKGCTVR